ncbi:eukaryotic translation initiation factor-like protein 3 subunit E [Rhizodiscina lignyota]|uniref:Eukaryotic translation initiation factor 3 subunit E n=1 Tax=Rhizodiscina lignyota TaxID=1504668 RepID=A0A9P4ICE9_9PEZI|nr:eukaryotic translation initiation factor-like protein 3 subunit E [Rhizodiscina lignyota]
MAQENGVDGPSQWDLLPKMAPFFDRHLLFPLLNDRDPTPDVQQAIFELLKGTNMVDYVGNLEADIKGLDAPPKEWETKRQDVMQKKITLEENTNKIQDIFDNPEIIGNLRSDKVANLNYLKENHDVNAEDVNALYEYGRFLFEMGDYGNAAAMLQRFRVLSTDSDLTNSATWGKLASDIIETDWESAMGEITLIREEYIDRSLFNNPLAQLQARTWLIHWSLFPYFRHEPARDTLTELFFSPAYINTIQTLCPWILRFLCAAVITNRNRTRNSNAYQKQLKDLIRIVKQEGYEYHDPLTDFIKALYVDFDFEEAQKKLVEAEQLFESDFFLGQSKDAFVDSARHLISESYCKIHQRIDIKDLSTRLGLNQDEGEKWIVNLIRDTRVDAKIDYQAGTVVMNHPPQSVYQQVIERTKGGFFRTQVLNSAVGR